MTELTGTITETMVAGMPEARGAEGVSHIPVRDADDFAQRFGIGPLNGSIEFEVSYRPQAEATLAVPTTPALNINRGEQSTTPASDTDRRDVRTRMSRMSSAFSRFRERGVQLSQRISESTRSALSQGQVEFVAARDRIVEAMTPRSRKVERAQKAAAALFEVPILSVPPVYDGGAGDKRIHLSPWIAPTVVETAEGESVTHYHYNETGKGVVAEIAAAVNADAVRTQTEFSIASEALKNAYTEAKKGIEASVVGSTSDSEKARAAAQIELVRRITSTARLRAYNSMRAEIRAQRLAQPVPQAVLDNRARAEAILSNIYSELSIDRLPFTPDEAKGHELWKQVSSRITLHYDMALVEAEVLSVHDGDDEATRGYYQDLIVKSARKACATARLMAWNQMTRPEPVVPVEALEIVEDIEDPDPLPEEVIIETEPAIEMPVAEPNSDVYPDSIVVDEPAIQEPRIARVRLTRANRLYLGAAALLLAGITGTGVFIYRNASRHYDQVSAAQAAEAALAESQAGQQTTNTDGVYSTAAQSQDSVDEATSTPPREGFRSLHSFGFTKPIIHREQAAPVQTFEAANADKQHDAQATEDAKPERVSRIDYTSGRPVKISVTCGDKVIQFVRKDGHNNPQDVQFDYFASSDDIPDGYEMPVDKAQRVIHAGIPITVYHSESDGEQEAAGDFQDYVLRNGGPNILPGCTYTAEQEGDNGELITEVSDIVDAFLMPARVIDPVLGVRNVDPDDVLGQVNRSLGQRYPEGKKPRVDGVDLTCYSFAHGDQKIDGVHYDDRETTRNLVWVLQSQ